MKFKFDITGIDCPNCAAKLAGNIGSAEGIDSAKINFLTEKLTIESSLGESEVMKIAVETARAFSKSVKITK